MVITPTGYFRRFENALIFAASSLVQTKDWIMNFKGISAPLNAGRLEQMLGLAPSRRDPESQDANNKSSGNEAIRQLEAESLYRSSAYK